jgi:hypothetical protein
MQHIKFNKKQEFKASTDWCIPIMWRNRFSLQQELHFAGNYHQTTTRNFFRNVIQLQKQNNYLLSQGDNADEMPLCSVMIPSYTTGNVHAKSVVIKTSGNRSIRLAA